MNRIILLLVAIPLFLISCNSNTEKTEKLIIASEQGDCVGVVPMKCLLVKKEGKSEWEFFYNDIEGFNYEPGYEYVLEIKTEKIENPVADGSSLKYILVKEVSKTQKISADLPQISKEENSDQSSGIE